VAGAAVMRHGVESDYLALIAKHYSAAFKEMKEARSLAEHLLAAQAGAAALVIASGRRGNRPQAGN
jgi:hypothetical protein